MTPSKALSPTSRKEFEIAIICVKALEYDTICILLDGFWDKEGDSFGRAKGDLNTYTTGYIGKFNVVVVLLSNSGQATAAGTAASLRSSYSCVELLLLIGTCDGVPNTAETSEKELLQGDVIISETIVEYELSSHYERLQEKNTINHRLGPANKNIRSFIASLKTERGCQRLREKATSHLRRIQSRPSSARRPQRRKVITYEYPGSENDMLFEPKYCHRHYHSSECECAGYLKVGDPVCDESRELLCSQTGCENVYLVHRARLDDKQRLEQETDFEAVQEPHIFFGRFGSSNTIINSGTVRDLIAQKHNIIAFEVEAAGVWDELPCIIVKGVSGYGDGHRTKSWESWQNFATATAAAVAKGLIESYTLTDDSPAAEATYQKNLNCLRSLFITNPRDDKIRIKDTKGGLLFDAYKWILDNEAYQDWCGDGESHMLWIKGDPGKGKTMLLCGIIEELERLSSRNVYYFFCQATESRLSNATAILRGLLYMLLRQQPILIAHVRVEYETSGTTIFEDSNSCVAMLRIFSNILGDPSMKEAIFVIDALDECLTDLPQLLDFLAQSSDAWPHIRWLVSSRNEQNIHDVLQAAESKSTVSLELNAESVSAAVNTYISYKVQLLSEAKRYKQHIKKKVEQYLRENADGTFLWVALVCSQLEKAPRLDPLPKSADYPPGLDRFYERMITNVYSSSVSDLSKKILAIAAVTRRPLTTQEFMSLINEDQYYEDDVEDSGLWEDILGYCGSFLTMKDHIIYFVHQSAKDFLINKASDRLFPDGQEQVNRNLFTASISAMKILNKDMYGLIKPGFFIDDLPPDTLSSGPLAPIAYCCVYWVDHLERSISRPLSNHRDDANSYKLMSTFLRTKFIYWLEALSLLRNIYEGTMSIQKLEKLAAEAQQPELKELVWDTYRFIQMFGKVIADFPLQVYISGLVFCPTQSMTRRLFKTEAPSWVHIWPDSEPTWTPCIRRFEGHESDVRSLDVSSCGTWLASSAADKTIRIWEIKTGRLVQSMKISHYLSACISFSPWKSNELASENTKKDAVIIWDVTTAKIIQRLEIGKFHAIEALSFLTSTDNLLGCHIRAGDRGPDIISIWNTEKGQKTYSIELPLVPGDAYIVAFSPRDGNIYATVPGVDAQWSKKIVEIRNANADDDIRKLQQYEQVLHTQFSPMGHLLVTHNGDNPDSRSECSITLFDAATGSAIWTAATKIGSIYRLPHTAFLNDGRMVITTYPNKVEIWSTASGQCLQKFNIRSGNLNMLLGGKGKEIFVANGKSIDIMEFDTPESLSRVSDDDDDVEQPTGYDVALSPDGKMLAAVTYPPDEAITVWDIALKRSIFTQKLGKRKQSEHRIAFSPNSRRLVCRVGISLWIWDISSSGSIKLLFTYTFADWAYACRPVFSQDSQCLATSRRYSHGNMEVEVWDVGSLKRLTLLRREEEIVASDIHLALSPDGKLLAVSWTSNSQKITRIEIWDTASRTGVGVKYFPFESFDSYFKASPLFSGSPVSVYQPDKVELKQLRFLDNSHVVLDLYKGSDFRAVLRMKADPQSAAESKFSIVSRAQEEPCYAVEPTNSWVTFEGERVLWLPPEHRGDRYSWDSQKNRVVVSASYHDRLTLIEFCCDNCLKQMFTLDATMAKSTCCSLDGQSRTYTRGLHDWVVECFDMDLPDDQMSEVVTGAMTDLSAHALINSQMRHNRFKE